MSQKDQIGQFQMLLQDLTLPALLIIIHSKNKAIIVPEINFNCDDKKAFRIMSQISKLIAIMNIIYIITKLYCFMCIKA